MNNLEWLDSLGLDELTAWMGAEHVEPTNGNGGETNGIRASAPSECDEYEAIVDALTRQRDEWKAKAERASEHAEQSEIERDEFSAKLQHEMELNAQNRNAHDLERIQELEYERDEWKAKAEQAQESYLDAKDARDMWHERYVELEGSSKVRAGSSSAKRAAAVNRLRGLEEHVMASSIQWALFGLGRDNMSPNELRDALIDMLADDDGAARGNDGVTNLEWHYVHDEGFCVAVGEQALARLDDAPSHPNEVFGWLMAPHGDARSDAPTLRDLYGVLGDENDPETPDSAEIPRKTGEQDAGFSSNTDRAESIADLLGQTNNVTDEGLAYLAKWHLPSVISMLHDYEDEKLMRDCDLEMNVLLSTEGLQAKVDELQSEIAKRNKGIERLKRQRDEARAQLDRKPTDAVREFAARYEQRIAELEDELHRSYDAQSAKAEELTLRGVHIAELEAEVVMLTERQCPGYEPESHYCCYHAQDFELNDSTVSRLKRENARLTKERDGWRMRCGELLDAAHAMQGAADAWDEEADA